MWCGVGQGLWGGCLGELPLLGLAGHRLVGEERLRCASLVLGRCYLSISLPSLSHLSAFIPPPVLWFPPHPRGDVGEWLWR